MRRRRVVYAPEARRDLENIGRWLTLNASAAVALRFVDRVRHAIGKLEYASERGTLRDEQRGLRLIGILPTVSIAFSVEDEAVVVHRILHNGQDWRDT